MSHPMTGSTGDNSITAPLKTRTVDFTGKMVRWICILLFLFAAIQLFYGIYLAILPQERFSAQMTQESWWIQPDGDAFSLSSRIPFSVLPAVESELHSPKMAQLSSLFASWLTCLLWGGCFSRLTPSSPAFGQDILPLQRKTAAESGFLAFCRLPRLYSPLCYSPC